jgi:hypothetical protein
MKRPALARPALDALGQAFDQAVGLLNSHDAARLRPHFDRAIDEAIIEMVALFVRAS